MLVHALTPSLEHFLRVLRPMQSTSCRIASQSEMVQRGAVCVPVCLSELRHAAGSDFPSFFGLWHVLIVFSTSAVSYRSPQKTRTITNHRPTRLLSRLRHGIEVAARLAGTARTLVPSPDRLSPMLRSGNLGVSYRSDQLDCL